jgi:hypothetical protein
MRRRTAKIAGVTAVGAAIALTAAWFVFVQQTERAMQQWVDTQRENGVEVTWQSLKFTGYPLRANAQIGEPQIIVRQPNRVATWKPPLLTFKFSSISPQAIDFASPGTHDLNVTSNDKTWSAVVEARTLKGQALFPSEDYRRIEQLTGRFADMRVTPSGWADPLTVERGNFEATRGASTPVDPGAVHPRGESLALDLAARDIGLPADLLQGNALESLGPLVSTLSSKMLVKGELNAGSADIKSLTAWRDGGGTVEFTSIELLWGPLRVTANGTLALDGELQPVGSFATRIAGLEKFITAMETSGVLSPSDAAIARITLAVLTRASDDGGPDRAEIPITLQDRILRLGPVALVQFAPITWQ